MKNSELIWFCKNGKILEGYEAKTHLIKLNIKYSNAIKEIEERLKFLSINLCSKLDDLKNTTSEYDLVLEKGDILSEYELYVESLLENISEVLNGEY